MKTQVMFRIFQGEVTAFFPYEIEGNNIVSCYVHLGQHVNACWDFHKISKPAKPSDYSELYQELTNIGYDLEVINRRNHKIYLRALTKFYQQK